MLTGSRFRPVVKDAIIVGIGVAIIWGSLMAVFGTQNPFYVVSSGSMVPALQVYDIIVVRGNAPFEQVEVGDIIVFDRPSDHDRVIVHRVAAITDDDPYTVRTLGDANPGPIPGTDYPITADEYIGTVEHVVPQVGFVTRIFAYQIGGIPLNYVLIIIIVGAVIAKQALKPKLKERSGPRAFDRLLSDTRRRLDKHGIDAKFSLEYARRAASMPSIDPKWPRAARLREHEVACRWDEYELLYEECVAEKLPGRLADVRAQRAAARAHNDYVRAMLSSGRPVYAYLDATELDALVAGTLWPQLTLDATKEGKARITFDVAKLTNDKSILRPVEARCLPAGHQKTTTDLGELTLEHGAPLRDAITEIDLRDVSASEAVAKFANDRGLL